MSEILSTQLESDDKRIIAYRHSEAEGWLLEPASVRRDWMDATTGKFAYRCLPLSMANQSGWVVRSPGTVCAVWGGKVGVESLKLKFVDCPKHFEKQAMSHFGHGIISFMLPWVFRTPPGVALLVRGPTNQWVANAHPLDGMVETDWISTAFTMNWQIIARNKEAWFRKGEPICMLTPVRMDLMEDLVPEHRELHTNPVLMREIDEFDRRRGETNKENFRRFMEEGESAKRVHELDYTRGKTPSGQTVDQHRTNIKLKRWNA